MKPSFSVQFMGSNIVPCSVRFTDTFQSDEERITMWNFGDGTLATWDSPDQTSLIHTYKRAGTWSASAWADRVMSEIIPVTVIAATPPPPPPVPERSWWEKIIAWILKIIGYE